MTVIIYPGLGLGGTFRPRLIGTMGYAPVGSTLAPVDEILSLQPSDVTSREVFEAIEGLEQMLIESDEPIAAIESPEPQSIESLEARAIESEEPSDIISDEPIDGIESEEPT